MDDVFKIRLKVDNEEYPLKILRSDEEDYRNAAKRIDYKLREYRTAFPQFGAGMHWMMVAVDLAHENQQLKRRNDTQPFSDKIAEWGKDIDLLLETSDDGDRDSEAGG